MKKNIFNILLDKYLILTDFRHAISAPIWEILAPSLNDEIQELLSEMVIYNGECVAANILLTRDLNDYFDNLYGSVVFADELSKDYLNAIKDVDEDIHEENKKHLQKLINMNLQLADDKPVKTL